MYTLHRRRIYMNAEALIIMSPSKRSCLMPTNSTSIFNMHSRVQATCGQSECTVDLRPPLTSLPQMKHLLIPPEILESSTTCTIASLSLSSKRDAARARAVGLPSPVSINWISFFVSSERVLSMWPASLSPSSKRDAARARTVGLPSPVSMNLTSFSILPGRVQSTVPTVSVFSTTAGFSSSSSVSQSSSLQPSCFFLPLPAFGEAALAFGESALASSRCKDATATDEAATLALLGVFGCSQRTDCTIPPSHLDVTSV
mmetsp:Transcript_151581/g.264113  ORF Transcript_151581/g.264113 Transcript_151581/m.264113 type:complete len:258 (+) Transcript_151581:37-810(+)